MATASIDRRVLRTRGQLQDALVALILEKGFDAVTVQDVIDRANVGRSTFYAHFEDKEDLFLSRFTGMQTQLQQHMKGQDGAHDGLWEISRKMFEHVQGHDRMYKALVGKRAGHLMLTHLHQFLLGLVRGQLRQRKPAPKGDRLEIVANHVVSSLTAMIVWWLDNGKPGTAEEMSDTYRRLVQPGVDGWGS